MKKRIWSVLMAALSASAIVAASALVVVAHPAPANAWSTTDFKPGNIIDDGLFYNGNSMSVAEVQAFLNKRVPQCWLGRAGYEVGKPVTWNGPTKLASKCTRDFTTTTSSRAANAYCKAYTGAPNEKAAAIISKVGAACGISPKVLLVMLEKEQSLITDPWPNENQYFMAMGYACPDSGPGGTAACDPKQGGFFQQVYRAAWQLKVYRAHSNSYSYKPLKSNYIQWHPSQSCGGSNVYIENWATAALYIYTPYQPNQAALRAGSGTGDKCSSYGNRNFYILWNSWFGASVIDDQMSPGIRQVFDQALASGFNYGKPLSARRTVSANGGGFQMEFENGLITESKVLGKSFGILRGWMMDAYLAAGGAEGSWGFLASGISGVAADGNYRAAFQHGTTVYDPKNVVMQHMPTKVFQAWQKRGEQNGPLGFPTQGAYRHAAAAVSQLFQGGTLMVSGGGNAVLNATELQSWKTLGGYAAVGLVTGDAVAFGGKSYRPTQKGGIVQTSAKAHVFVPAGIFERFVSSEATVQSWGWPVSPIKLSGGIGMKFQNGNAVYSSTTGVAAFMQTGTFDKWVASGGPTGATGFPVQDTVVIDGQGSYQVFARQTVYYGPYGKPLAFSPDAYRTAYEKSGGPTGPWGWPAGPGFPVGKGYAVPFQNGNAVLTPPATIKFVSKQAAPTYKQAAPPEEQAVPTEEQAAPTEEQTVPTE